MIDAEQIYEKAKGLDPERLRTLDAFLDFLLARESSEGDESAFAPTRLEPPDTPSVYRGPPLTLEQMREAVDAEAGRHR